MSARMEKVREALNRLPITYKGPRWEAALAEVEEWETRLASCERNELFADRKAVAAVARAEAAEAEVVRVNKEYADWKEAWNKREVACEAAEAEADGLKAALQYALDSMESPDAEYAPGKDIYDSHMIRGAIVRARAALAPADRNTT